MRKNNLEINYLYRDSGNYKKHTTVVVANPEQHSPEAVKEALRRHFAAEQVWPDILHFQPERLGWPTAYFCDHDETGNDLNLHEIEAITPTDDPATDKLDLCDLVR